MRRLKILTWHVHGAYLNALCRNDHDWYLPVKTNGTSSYGGRGTTLDLPHWVHDIPADQVHTLDLDLVIYQSQDNYFVDGPNLLGDRMRVLPGIYVEHNTPRPHAVESRHPMADEQLLLVHVTEYNRLMWDSGSAPTAVIEHGVFIDKAARYDGSIAAGATVVNNIHKRGRFTGFDLFQQASKCVPLVAIGMGTEEIGGIGDIPYRKLHPVVAQYRFLFSPMRYTSLPLAVIEAMTMGMPIVALATTELPTVIRDGESGYISCDLELLIDRMRGLLENPKLAQQLGEHAQQVAAERFGMARFVADWNIAFNRAIGLAADRHRIDAILDRNRVESTRSAVMT